MPAQQQPSVEHRRQQRRVLSRAVCPVVDPLEGRRLLAAGGPFDIDDVPVFTPTTDRPTDVRAGPLAKAGGTLAGLVGEFRAHVKAGGERVKFASERYADVLELRGDQVAVTVRTRGSVDAMSKVIAKLGGQTVYKSRAANTLLAYVPIGTTPDLAAREEVAHLRPMFRPETHRQGRIDNEANQDAGGDAFRRVFDADGSGVKVGVLSDSVREQPFFDIPFEDENEDGLNDFRFTELEELDGLEYSTALGELPGRVRRNDLGEIDLVRPAVTVVDELEIDDNPFARNRDEGRAMLEIIHDVAPGADLSFATAIRSLQSFADNVRALREDGADVIVDDVGYADQSPFSEDVVSDAANDVVDDGAVYLSAAGNSDDNGYRRQANWVLDSATGRYLMDFDPGEGVDTRLGVEIDDADGNASTFEFSNLLLWWDDAFNGVTGDVNADVDARIFDRDFGLFSEAVDDNFATGIPREDLFLFSGEFEIEVSVFATADNDIDQLPTAIQLREFGTNLFDGADVEYPGFDTPTSVGQPTARNAIGVAAVEAGATRRAGVARPVTQEFSSFGPGFLLYDVEGNRLPEPQVTQAPLVAGIDGVSTSVQGFDNFEGTSAAAPNVAAIVALLKSLRPETSNEDLRQTLIDAAKFEKLNGADFAEYDPQAGFGLVDAVRAGSLLLGDDAAGDEDVGPVGFFEPVTPFLDVGGVGELTVTFSEPVSGLELEDFTVLRDGNRVRFRGGETLTSSDDGRTYVLGNLRSITRRLGDYVVRLDDDAEVTAADGGDADQAAPGAVTSFVTTLRPARNVSATTIAEGDVLVRFSDTNPDEQGYRVERSTDPDFESGVSRFDLEANQTEFVDDADDLTPGEAYFYRVRALRDGRAIGGGDVARASIASAGEVLVDNPSSGSGGFDVQPGELEDGTTFGGTIVGAQGDGPLPEDAEEDEFVLGGSTVEFRAPGGLEDGREYFVYARYVTRADSARNVRYVVRQPGDEAGDLEPVVVDQSKNGGGYVLLGRYLNAKGRGGDLFVQLTTAGAEGFVNGDAVRFLPVANDPLPSPVPEEEEEDEEEEDEDGDEPDRDFGPILG